MKYLENITRLAAVAVSVFLTSSCNDLSQRSVESLCEPIAAGATVSISSSAVMASDNIEFSYVYDQNCSQIRFLLDKSLISLSDERTLSDTLYTAPRNIVTRYSEITFDFSGTARRQGEEFYLSLDTVSHIKPRILPTGSSDEKMGG